MKILFTLILIIEIFLSHQPGEESGAESRALAKTLHVSDGVVRTAAHVILFGLLSFLMLTAFPNLSPALRIGVVGAWAFLDELTKIPVEGRHFSWVDCGWNCLGVLIGAILWLLNTTH